MNFLKKLFVGKKILGYQNGKPFYEPDNIVTRSFILCSKCNKSIHNCNGPVYGIVCIECHDELIGVTQAGNDTRQMLLKYSKA